MALRDPEGEHPAQPWTGAWGGAAGASEAPPEPPPPARGPQLISLPSPNHLRRPQRTPGQKRTK